MKRTRYILGVLAVSLLVWVVLALPVGGKPESDSASKEVSGQATQFESTSNQVPDIQPRSIRLPEGIEYMDQMLFSKDGEKLFIYAAYDYVNMWPLIVTYWLQLLWLPIGIVLLICLRCLFRIWRKPLLKGELHCRKCRYCLAGSVGDVCSECGSDLKKRKPIVGRGFWRRARMPLVLCIVLPTSWLGLSQVQWPVVETASQWWTWQWDLPPRWVYGLAVESGRSLSAEGIVEVDVSSGRVQRIAQVSPMFHGVIEGIAINSPILMSPDGQYMYYHNWDRLMRLNTKTFEHGPLAKPNDVGWGGTCYSALSNDGRYMYVTDSHLREYGKFDLETDKYVRIEPEIIRQTSALTNEDDPPFFCLWNLQGDNPKLHVFGNRYYAPRNLSVLSDGRLIGLRMANSSNVPFDDQENIELEIWNLKTQTKEKKIALPVASKGAKGSERFSKFVWNVVHAKGSRYVLVEVDEEDAQWLTDPMYGFRIYDLKEKTWGARLAGNGVEGAAVSRDGKTVAMLDDDKNKKPLLLLYDLSHLPE